jgi:hypothetical protein
MQGKNTKALRALKLIDDDPPFTDEDYAFLESLNAKEMSALKSIKAKLDEKGIPAQIMTSKSLVPIL